MPLLDYRWAHAKIPFGSLAFIEDGDYSCALNNSELRPANAEEVVYAILQRTLTCKGINKGVGYVAEDPENAVEYGMLHKRYVTSKKGGEKLNRLTFNFRISLYSGRFDSSGNELCCHYEMPLANYNTLVAPRTALTTWNCRTEKCDSKIQINYSDLVQLKDFSFKHIRCEIINGSHFHGDSCFHAPGRVLSSRDLNKDIPDQLYLEDRKKYKQYVQKMFKKNKNTKKLISDA